MKSFLLRWYAAIIEAFACLGLGIRSTFSQGLWWRSALLCTAVMVFWVWFYIHFAKQVLTVVGVVAFVSAYGLTVAGGGGGGGSVVAMGGMGPALVQLVVYAALLAAALYFIVFAFLVVSTIRLPLNLMFMDRSVRAVARDCRDLPLPAYPTPQPRLPIGKVILRYGLLLVGLCVPVVSGWLLILIALYVNVRLLYATAVRRVYGNAPGRLPLYQHARSLLVLGALILPLVFIPVVNLLLPAVLCTSVLHLVRRVPHG